MHLFPLLSVRVGLLPSTINYRRFAHLGRYKISKASLESGIHPHLSLEAIDGVFSLHFFYKDIKAELHHVLYLHILDVLKV